MHALFKVLLMLLQAISLVCGLCERGRDLGSLRSGLVAAAARLFEVLPEARLRAQRLLVRLLLDDGVLLHNVDLLLAQPRVVRLQLGDLLLQRGATCVSGAVREWRGGRR